MRFIKPLMAMVISPTLAAMVVAAGGIGFAGRAAPFAPPSVSPTSVAAPPRYTVTEVAAAPPGAEFVNVAALNDRGQVVGQWSEPKTNGSSSSSFLWERGKPARTLGRLPNGYLLQPLAINNRGQVVGIAWGEDPNNRKRRAFLWENGKPRDLGTPAGETSEAFDINERGEVFLTSYAFEDKTKPNHVTKHGAFLWTAAKGFHPLPEHFDGMRVACALNDRGQIAGNAMISFDEWRDTLGNLSRDEIPDFDGARPWRAFLYEKRKGGTFQRLPVERSWSTHAEAINNRGEVLLQAELLAKETQGGHVLASTKPGGLYLWRDGRATPIIANSGSTGLIYGQMGASSLNDAGDVTTTSYTGKGQERQSHAVLWRKGTLWRLDDCLPPNSGWRLLSARQINNRGQIIGMGMFEGKKRAYLLTPIHSGR